MRQSIQELKPYAIDEREWEIKLDANERAGDLPENVKQAVMERLKSLPFHLYPDMGMKTLRQAISEELGVAADQVLIGSGSSELLMALCQVFGGPGKRIIYPNPSFSMYGIYAKLSESQGVAVDLNTDYTLDISQVITAAEDQEASLIMLCNPNNPTGTTMSQADIEAVLQAAKCPVVVDEAYYEYFGETAMGLLNKYSNLIITRTFSKAFGLASARVGYMLADANIAAAVNKALMPYHVNAFSLAAAEVVYQQRKEVLREVRETIAERERLFAALEALPGVKVYPSRTNFLLLDPGKDGLYEVLAERSIGVRNFSQVPGLKGCFRITIGSSRENNAVLSVVKEFVGEG